MLKMRLSELETQEGIPTEAELFTWVDTLTHAVTETIDGVIPKCRPAPSQNPWWSQELNDRWAQVHRLAWKV